MTESLFVTSLPLAFLALLYGSEALQRIRGIYKASDPPIGKAVFFCCKYAIPIPWGAMAARSWGLTWPWAVSPGFLKWPALALWGAGFFLLFWGRLGLGSAFRVGLSRETPGLKTGGVYRLSRNPMYLGIDATLAAAVLYTGDPIVAGAAAFIAAAHHRIIQAEEALLRGTYGDAFAGYCRRVRRYI
jgi:protein-S-isoprenylcysteine O-methyltransferase Ste14